MKKLLFVILIGALALPMFQSCKKGPNDPAISLKSRASRLTGDWKILEGSEVQNNSGTLTNITINDNSYTETTGGVTVTGLITVEISILKDGTYTWKESLTIGGTTEITDQEGNWSFLGANKGNDVKNKQCVAFQITKETRTVGGTSTVSTFEGWWPMVFFLDELSSKQIVMKRDYSYTGSSTDSDEMEYTLIPQ